jgi:hypothetical protein
MFCCKDFENINIKMDGNALKQVPQFMYPGSIITEDGKNKEDTIQRIKEAKVMFNNKEQLLCSNSLSLEIELYAVVASRMSYFSYPSWNLLEHFTPSLPFLFLKVVSRRLAEVWVRGSGVAPGEVTC